MLCYSQRWCKMQVSLLLLRRIHLGGVIIAPLSLFPPFEFHMMRTSARLSVELLSPHIWYDPERDIKRLLLLPNASVSRQNRRLFVLVRRLFHRFISLFLILSLISMVRGRFKILPPHATCYATYIARCPTNLG